VRARGGLQRGVRAREGLQRCVRASFLVCKVDRVKEVFPRVRDGVNNSLLGGVQRCKRARDGRAHSREVHSLWDIRGELRGQRLPR
jgi:hypothetical protein